MLANDSHVGSAASTGTTFATHLRGGKEFPVGMMADESGHIIGTAPTWVVATGNSANVAAARTTFIDLFNAPGSGVLVTVHALFIIPTMAAVTGVGLTWEVLRTTAVGTGGTVLTPRPMDTTNPALPSQVTCRLKPTGGATTTYAIAYPNTSSEETSPYAALASAINHLGLVGDPVLQELVLQEGEGVKLDQTTSSAVGSTNVVLVVVVE